MRICVPPSSTPACIPHKVCFCTWGNWDPLRMLERCRFFPTKLLLRCICRRCCFFGWTVGNWGRWLCRWRKERPLKCFYWPRSQFGTGCTRLACCIFCSFRQGENLGCIWFCLQRTRYILCSTGCRLKNFYFRMIGSSGHVSSKSGWSLRTPIHNLHTYLYRNRRWGSLQVCFEYLP